MYREVGRVAGVQSWAEGKASVPNLTVGMRVGRVVWPVHESVGIWITRLGE